VKDSREEFEPDDGVDDHDEHDQQRDVEQRDHRHQDTVQHNLETWERKHSNKNVKLGDN